MTMLNELESRPVAAPVSSSTAGIPSRWPLVGRGPTLRRIRSDIEHGASLAMFGAGGIGKTRLLDEVRTTHRGPVVSIDGTHRDARHPLGALMRSFPDLGELGERRLTEVRRVVVERLRRIAAGRRLLLVVDDAQLLDPTTARGIHEVVEDAEWCDVLLAVRTDVPVTSGIATAWEGPSCRSLHLDVLDVGAVETLSRGVLGGPIDARLAAAVCARSDGLPLAVVELLRGGLETGVVVDDGGLWRSTGELPSHRLTGLVEHRLRGLAPRTHAAAELVALGEPVPEPALVELVAAQDVHDLEVRGLVRWEWVEGRRSLRIARPLDAEVLRARLSLEQRTDQLGRLIEGFERAGMAATASHRLATWRLEIGVGSRAGFEHAARARYDPGDDRFAKRAARAASPPGSGHDALLTAASSAVELGRIEEAEHLLTGAHATASTDRERERSVLASARASWAAGRPDEARRDLATLGARNEDVDLAGELIAFGAVMAAVDGDVAHVRDALYRGADTNEAPSNGRIRLLLGAAAALISDEIPEAPDVRSAMSRGTDVEDARDALPLAPSLMLAAATVVAAGSGLTQQLAVAGEQLDAALLEGVGDRAALWGTVVGRLQLRAGNVVAAERHLQAASDLFEEVDTIGLRRPTLALLAIAVAQGGILTHARHLLTQVALGEGDGPRLCAWVGIAEAEILAIESGAEVGARAAVDVGDRAAAHGLEVSAVAAWELAVRAGWGCLVRQRLVDAAMRHPTTRVHALAQAAAALADRRPADLEQAARDLAAEGRRRVAADVADRASDLGAGNRSAALAAGLRTTCIDPASGIGDPGPQVSLQPRSRTIARWVAAGSSSASVAAELGISVRTVDNHLGRIYRRLGVSGRRELARCYPLDLAPLAEPNSPVSW